MTRWLFFVVVAAWPLTAVAQQQSIMSTRHNLSVTGPGPVRATSETQVCVFCHVGHNGLGTNGNRPVSSAAYKPYNSSTLASPQGLPNGSTRVCLSCHDGTVALGQTAARGRIRMGNAGAGETIPSGPSHMGTDLGRSHPVSFTPRIKRDVRSPAPEDPVKLDRAGRVQCTSCHDPHRDATEEGKFLVKSTRGSALCLSCHAKEYWLANPSSHQASLAAFTPSLGATTAFTTIADTGCASCHQPHGSPAQSRLLRDIDPSLCLQCHGGRVARADIRSDLVKPYSHPILTSDPAAHDAAEGPQNLRFPLPESRASDPRHVVCSDCHNPHASFQQPAVAPRASGLLSGVWGVDSTGNRIEPLQHEYEVCFKCHGDSANQPQRRARTPLEATPRSTVDVNLRRVFDLSAPSFHPVEGPGRNHDVPGLIAPLTTASVIYCSDCHASDGSAGAGGVGPRGPHGSIYRHILERNLSAADNSVESAYTYALCYKCHDRAVLLDPARSAFPLHRRHVVDDAAPCGACHDPHGVSSLQGNAINNAHLVNFDTSIVAANGQGMLSYTMTGPRRGSCSLTCHKYKHADSRYDPSTR